MSIFSPLSSAEMKSVEKIIEAFAPQKSLSFYIEKMMMIGWVLQSANFVAKKTVRHATYG